MESGVKIVICRAFTSLFDIHNSLLDILSSSNDNWIFRVQKLIMTVFERKK
jgi:hypothetical protein